jgi:prepilin-type N-terminal cleavage/methylation domain-containing protein
MKKHILIYNQKGATLVEVLVAIALAGIMMPALAAAFITSNDARPTATAQLTAETQLQEMTTAVRSIREQAWSNIATDGTYHPVVSGSGWALASGSSTTGGFTDQIVISDVERDSSGNIVASSGTTDPSTKQIVATVSWTTPTSSSVSSTLYLSRWQNEASWTQTTVADFTADSLANLTVTNSSGGELQLTPGQTNGTVESTTFDAGANASFNYLSFTDSLPSGTSIQFQIASNNDNATWNFVGPDGTNATYYTSPGQIPLDAVSGRYFRYQATLSTTNASTPVLDDVTLTYSP